MMRIVIPIVFGELGTVPKRLAKNWEKLEIWRRIETRLMTVLLPPPKKNSILKKTVVDLKSFATS